MSSRTTTTPTGDPKQPDCLPFREMVQPPESKSRIEFLGTPVPARAPSRAPNPRNAKHHQSRGYVTASVSSPLQRQASPSDSDRHFYRFTPMATNYDKFIIHPAYDDGHDWDEFIEALERAGLEKSGHPKICWSQILHPRTTLFRSKDEGPFDIVTVELTWIGDGTDGPFKKDRHYIKSNCSTCGRGTVRGGVCNHCVRDRRRRQSPSRSSLYRRRHGIVKDRFLETCPVCGKEFRPKRSTARFFSTTCRVKNHRHNIRTR